MPTVALLAPYQQIAAEIRHEIVTGHLPVGGKLPSEHVLAAEHQVARATIQSALRVLRSEGLIASRKGAGNYVTPLAAADASRCPARIELDHAQVGWLSRLPAPATDPDRVLHCELEHPHPGPHAGLAQHTEDTGWWVQWSLTASEINPLPPCPDGTPCLLFESHPGHCRHTPLTTPA
ncbi:winged helix-turn-helix domain-containing protein [Actinoplanes sp. NPDC049596]|uniref:GntR family transcriptional regulator n=1 Tax=unclassified Actinoplanes TaxID=2626549 RepID=UPI00344346C4